jgi:hypothetical protein
MKLLQLFYVDDKFIHPLYARYVGAGITGNRGTPRERDWGNDGDDHIIEEFMQNQIGDDKLVPLSQDEAHDGEEEREDDDEDDNGDEQEEGGGDSGGEVDSGHGNGYDDSEEDRGDDRTGEDANEESEGGISDEFN